MDWPLNYHSKGRPVKARLQVRCWSLLYIGLAFVFWGSIAQSDSSPPVADVEDLFKDEGFLRMSRGGEAFGRRPPPPLILNPPPHLSTQTPPRHFQTTVSTANLPKDKIPPTTLYNRNEGNVNSSRNSNDFRNERNSSSSSQAKPLEKDVGASFSKVSDSSGGDSVGGGSGISNGGDSSDGHPLLAITPAAPGDPFDFNPILSNPAVTRILAGSSGRIPQWEPMPDSHDSVLPEVNYTGNTNNNNRNRVHPNTYYPTSTPASTILEHHSLPGGSSISHNPKNPIFVPSPVSSNGSPTMYNMDQMTNNIAIPKHILPNPSNLATSRSTIVADDERDEQSRYHHSGNGGGRRLDSNYNSDHHQDKNNNHYGSNFGANNYNNHLDENNHGGDAGNSYSYDDEDPGYGDENGVNAGGDAQGKRGIWKESGQTDPSDSRHENGGLKYVVVCDALCGAWKHQCKLMGILFSITSVLCVVFAFFILYTLHFGLKDFVPFTVILLLLFTTSTSRAFILLSGWFCSPDSRPSWLPIVSTLPPAFFAVTILVILRLTRFPFPFIKSYTISCQTLTLLSSLIIFPPLAVSIGAAFHEPSHSVLTQIAWILGHMALIIIAVVYLCKFKSFYTRISHEGSSSSANGALNSCGGGYNGTIMSGTSTSSLAIGNNNLSSAVKKRGLVVKWGCLQARAMFGTALLALALSTMIIISVAMNRGECEDSSTWTAWILSLCARMLEFAIVILLLLVTITSTDIRLFRRLSRVPINKTNVGLMNADIFPTMVSSNSAVQRCIPMYSSNHREDGIRDDQALSRSSLRGKTFGERTLPGERVGEYRSSVGRGLPLRLGNGPSHSLPVTPMDGFPGMRLPEPAPASLLVTKVVFGTPAVSREVNLNHQLENPMHCTGGPGSKDDRETSNIYASLESVKVASNVNQGSSTGSNHSGSDRVLLSAQRDYIYSISRDITRTIDSIYDSSRPRSSNIPHPMDGYGPPHPHTAEHIGSIPNLNGGAGRPTHFNVHPHNIHHTNHGRTDLARTIDRIRYAAATAPSTPFVTTPTTIHPGRNFVLQLGGAAPNHMTCIGNPPPYCSSDSSHDVTPDSGIVADMHPKRPEAEAIYGREYRRNSSIEDIRRLPLIPLPRRTPGSTPMRTPTTPTNPSLLPSPASAIHPTQSPLYIPNPTPSNSIVGRVEHLLNQTEHILSRTESLDGNSHSAGIQRLLTHKEQLETVEKLLAQAEYAIWLEKKNCAQNSQMSPTDSTVSPYGCNNIVNSQQSGGNSSFNMSANSSQQPLLLSPKDNCNNYPSNSIITKLTNHSNGINGILNSLSTANSNNSKNTSTNGTTHSNSNNNNSNLSNGGTQSSNNSNAHGGVTSGHYNANHKKISKTLEEESVV